MKTRGDMRLGDTREEVAILNTSLKIDEGTERTVTPLHRCAFVPFREIIAYPC